MKKEKWRPERVQITEGTIGYDDEKLTTDRQNQHFCLLFQTLERTTSSKC